MGRRKAGSICLFVVHVFEPRFRDQGLGAEGSKQLAPVQCGNYLAQCELGQG